MNAISQNLNTIGARFPEHAMLIRTIKDQIKTVGRVPDNDVLRAVLAANVARLAEACGGR